MARCSTGGQAYIVLTHKDAGVPMAVIQMNSEADQASAAERATLINSLG
jgi:hypothetical protein